MSCLGGDKEWLSETTYLKDNESADDEVKR